MHGLSDRFLSELLRRKYEIIQSNGQRVYAPQDQSLHRAVKGCEVFVGRIPRDIFEEELLPFFEQVGPVQKMRLMIDFTGHTRGYCFITYFSLQAADEAVRRFNAFEIRPNRSIGVYKSVDNCRLFVGGLPPEVTRQQLADALGFYAEGIVGVIMYKSHLNVNHNRGFAFVDFENHRLAAMARRRFSPGSLMLWDSPIQVDWAEPLPEVDPNVMANVCVLYIRNINVELSRDEFRAIIAEIIPIANVIRLHKTLDYAFVHFSSRPQAEFALSALKRADVDFEVMWARPSEYSRTALLNSPPQHFCTSLPPRSRRFVINRLQEMRTSSNTVDSRSSTSSLSAINSNATLSPELPASNPIQTTFNFDYSHFDINQLFANLNLRN